MSSEARKVRRIVCFGPGPLFKGGIANYNTSLAKTLDKFPDTEVYIVSWTQQYPAIIPRDFIDRSSKADFLEGTGVKVVYLTNYNNPFSWKKTYQYIRDLKPDIAIFQWAIAIQGLPMGKIIKKLKRNTDVEVMIDCHVVRQKESSSIDKRFTRMGLKRADTFITHSEQLSEQLRNTFPDLAFEQHKDGTRAKDAKRTIIKLYHPVYDLFTPDPDFDIEANREELGLKKNVFLFFGFIRKYKGLHNVIKAFAKAREERDDVSLLIVGESFWQTLDNKKFGTKIKNFFFKVAKTLFLRKSDDEREYRPLELVEELGLQDDTVIVNSFVPNEEVHKYFQVSDCIVLFYLTATPSGVESLAYNFEMPPIATNVGHFPETIKDGYNGYLAEPENIDSMAEVMLKFLDEPIPRSRVSETASWMSWENYGKAILNKPWT